MESLHSDFLYIANEEHYTKVIERIEKVRKTLWIGTANLTGAGLGMKGENTRNFEAGILSSDKSFVKQAIAQFDKVWMGSFCKSCKRKAYCSDPIL